MLNLFIGLLATMLANVLLGLTLSKLKQNFSKKKFLEGLVKIVSILGGVGLMYLTSYLNSDILVANINGTNVNLIDAIKMLFMAGIVMYGSQDLIKLKDILKLKIEILEFQEESTIKIPTENIIDRGE